jgi:hypothetical protein
MHRSVVILEKTDSYSEMRSKSYSTDQRTMITGLSRIVLVVSLLLNLIDRTKGRSVRDGMFTS